MFFIFEPYLAESIEGVLLIVVHIDITELHATDGVFEEDVH